MTMKLRGFEYPMALKRSLRPVIRSVRYSGLHPDDVLLASYPRSGSTWLRFMLADLLAPGMEWDDVNRVIPYVGEHRRAPHPLLDGGRLVKTHETATGPVRRAVYLARDPRDVVLSEYRLSLRGGSHETLDSYVARWVVGKAGPFGRWGNHVEYWLERPQASGIELLVIRFEELTADALSTLARIVEWIGIPADEDGLRAAVEGNTIGKMREKEDRAPKGEVRPHDGTHRFVGEGAAGGWRDKLDERQVRLITESATHALERLGYDTRASS